MKPLNAGVVPAAVATVTVRTSCAATGEISSATRTFVDDHDVIVAVSPEPLNATAVTPVRFCPEMLTANLLPAFPEVGEIEVTAMSPTVKPLNGDVVPAGVVTVTVRKPGAAPGAIVTTAVTLVDVHEEISAVTPVPLNAMLAAPVRLSPVRVAATAVPGAPDVGEMEVIVGAETVKPLNGGVAPPAVVTVTVREPAAAAGEIVKIAITLVEVHDVIDEVIPVPLSATFVAPVRPCPNRVAATVVPGAPDVGEMEVIVGAATVKPLNGGVVPAGVVTVTVCKPSAAPGAIFKASETLVGVVDVIAEVIPEPPKVTRDAPDRPTPIIDVVIVVPGAPDDGAMDEIDGMATVKPLKGAVVPEGVVTATVRKPRAAPGAIVTCMETDVAAEEVTTAVIPVPLKTTAVAPERPCPKTVAPIVVAGAPVDGEIMVIVGKATVKPLKGAVAPEGTVTVRLRKPSAAPGAIVTKTDRLVAACEIIAAVTPVPLKVTPVAVARPTPEITVLTVVPGAPNAGEIPVIAGNATRKPFTGIVVPKGVVTVTVRMPTAAPGATVATIDTVVGVTDVIAAVTPVPLNVTSVAPDRFCPSTDAISALPGTPDGGEIEVITGDATMKPLNGSVVPKAVVTVTVLNPKAAPDAMVTATVTLVDATEVIAAVIPVPLKATSVALEKPSPETVTRTVAPGAPDGGEITAITGTTTLSPPKGALVPDGVVTVTVRPPGAAPGSIVTVTPTLVGVTVVMTPVTPVPLKVTAVAPERPCPATVTINFVPGAPVGGVIEVITGKATVNPLNGALADDGVITVTVRNPSAAPGSTVTANPTLVAAMEVMAAVTPVPLKAMAVALKRFCPERVTANVVPGAPDGGEIDVITGKTTAKPLNGTLVPVGVVTVTVRNPNAAPGSTVTSIPTLVEVKEVMAALTPVPLKATAVAPERFCPDRLTAEVPGAPDEGERVVIVGTADEMMPRV